MVHLNGKNWGKVYEIIGSFEVVIGEKREGIPDGKRLYGSKSQIEI